MFPESACRIQDLLETPGLDPNDSPREGFSRVPQLCSVLYDLAPLLFCCVPSLSLTFLAFRVWNLEIDAAGTHALRCCTPLDHTNTHRARILGLDVRATSQIYAKPTCCASLSSFSSTGLSTLVVNGLRNSLAQPLVRWLRLSCASASTPSPV